MPNCLENPDWKVRDFNNSVLPNLTSLSYLTINICLKLNYCSPDQSRETSSSPTPGWRRCCPSTWERGSRPPNKISKNQEIFPYNQKILCSEESKPPSSIYLLVASRASLVSCTSRSMTAGSLSANSLNLAWTEFLDKSDNLNDPFQRHTSNCCFSSKAFSRLATT